MFFDHIQWIHHTLPPRATIFSEQWFQGFQPNSINHRNNVLRHILLNMTEQIKELTFDFHMSRIPINFLDIAKVYSIRDIWIFYAKPATNGVNITNHSFGTLFDTKTTDRNFDERFSNYSILIPFRYLKVFVNTLSYRLHISKN